MLTQQYDQMNFGVQVIRAPTLNGDGPGAIQQVLLVFQDTQAPLQAIIPFSPDGWENFKRTVANDGETPSIALAKSIGDVKPPPRMDVPRG